MQNLTMSFSMLLPLLQSSVVGLGKFAKASQMAGLAA
jgi:hypothetical protein